MNESSVSMRNAVKRLLAAIQRPEIEVTVRRDDLELLLMVNKGRESREPAKPHLHPAQQ